VDSLTHALVAAIVVYVLGFPHLIPFIVIGVVIIDADVIFSYFSDPHPSLYLFVHGGIAHSIFGVVVMTVLACAGTWTAALAGFIDPIILEKAGPVGFIAILAGAFLHIAMDLPATPGIPLFAPKSDTKYALFILPGPSLFMMAVSLVFLTWMATGIITPSQGIPAYLAIFTAFLLVRFVAFLVSRPGLRGTLRVIPQVNPLRWLAINDDGDAWKVQDYRIGRGMTEPAKYPKFKNTSPEEVARYLELPEVMRMRYSSYVVTAEKEGNTLIFSDPLRVSGRLFYPPHFKRVRIFLAGYDRTGMK